MKMETSPLRNRPPKWMSASLFTAIAVLASLGIAGLASSDEFGQCSAVSGCRPDNKAHSYCFGATMAGAGLQEAAGYGMSNLVAQTSFTKNFQSDCGSNTDVVFKRNDALAARGQYVCIEKLSGTNKCNRARIEFNPGQLANQLNKNKTACHEIGHSGGLAHGANNDCMISGHVSANHIHYNGHHVDHLNNQN